MKSILQNNKGQLDFPIITFVIIVFGLLFLAPVMLKIFTSVQTSVSTNLGNISSGGEIAQQNFNKVMNTAVNFWDKVILASFILALILMLISAFLIDTSPFWIILYIIVAFMLVLFAPDIVGSLSNIYGSSTFAGESARLTFMNTIITYFGEFLVGIIVITGIIIYGKVALSSSGNGGGGYRR